MSTTTLPIKKEPTMVSPADKKKGAELHTKAAEHHEQAAKSHHEAAGHHEAGHTDKAAASTVIAQGHHTLAGETQREIVKHHVILAKANSN